MVYFDPIPIKPELHVKSRDKLRPRVQQVIPFDKQLSHNSIVIPSFHK